MGTINQHRSKGGVISYRARIQRQGQKTLSATFPTLKDARRWMTLKEADIIAGRHFPEKKTKHTLSELFDHYQRDVMPTKAPETQRSQSYTVRYWKETLGHRFIDEIQPHEIKAHLTALSRQGRAPATITQYHTTLSHAYQTAILDYQW